MSLTDNLADAWRRRGGLAMRPVGQTRYICAMRTRLRIWGTVASVPVYGTAFYLVFWGVRPPRAWPIVLLLTVLWLFPVLLGYIEGELLRRLRARLAASGGSMCGRCAYPLGGLPREGKCPECAEPYDRERDGWRWWRDLELAGPKQLSLARAQHQNRPLLRREATPAYRLGWLVQWVLSGVWLGRRKK